MKKLSSKSRLALGLVLLSAFLLRLAYVLGSQASPYFDSPIMDPLYHLQWAQAFAAGENFQEGPFFRAPLYPWFLGTLLRLGSDSLLFVRIAQALLGTLTVGLGFQLGRRLFELRVGFVAALLIATNWVLIYFDGELLIPTLAIPLNLFALLMSARLAEDSSPRRCALAGIAWGLSAIARPNVLLLMPLLFGWLLLRSKPQWKVGLLAALALTAGTLVPILPLSVYNYSSSGDAVLISSQAGVNLWIGNNPESDGSTAIVPGTRPGWWEGFYDSIALAEQAEGRQLTAAEVSKHYSTRARNFFFDHPSAALSHIAWKLRLLGTNWELGNNADVRFFAQRFTPWMAVLPPSWALLAPLALLGLLVCRKRASATFPLWGFLLAYSASIVLFFVCSRFRAPLLPVLAILAAVALVQAADLFRAKRWPALGLGGAGFLLLSMLSMQAPPGIDDTGSMGHWALGIAKLSNNQAEAARDDFLEALEANPRNLYAIRDLAKSQQAMGDLLDACNTYQQALQLKPDEFQTRSDLVDLLIARKQLDDAQSIAIEGLRVSPDFATSYDTLARVQAARQDWPACASTLRQGMTLEPNHFYCNLRLGALLHGMLNDSCAAQEYLQRAATHENPPSENYQASAAQQLQSAQQACSER